jgi:hypothetical protein
MNFKPMKNSLRLSSLLLAFVITIVSCQQSEDESVAKQDNSVSTEVLNKLVSLGFDVKDKVPFKYEGGYLVEGDIYLTDADLSSMKAGSQVPVAEQYSTNNLVTGTPRNISIYIATTFPSVYVTAVNTAIARYNAENLNLTFSRTTTSSGATIRITRLSTSSENSGVLGSGGFPTSSGNPYGAIQLSGILQSTYGLSANGIATIIAHEVGHCIGFRHTDYYNRAISCGGSTSNEGTAGVGANLIPGTPSTATAAAKSFMLACTDGSDRPFNSADKIALAYLY